MLTLIILGTPTPKQSARFRIIKGKKGNFVSSYQKKSVKDAAKSIADQIREQLPKGFEIIDSPIQMDILFVFPPLKSWSKKKLKQLEDGETIYKDTKPDIDNTTKNLLDAMEKLVFANDSRICRIRIQKIYGFKPRTEVNLKEIK
ncbi:RusA-like Holliday junction resolvase [Cellulophaga phage phi46:3]|uniref:Holliday junction resolvase, RusA n=2 Tax=Pachyviridae TaxID=2946166 RepID=S0A1C6_9CAUD|nr:RusA-like Holliday junction resolvase [Cellulophaga phage phi46:3]YP_008241271.1 RusA-like Holliday junction resolvase [Cellulophaga phage phi18:3]AGO48590.1 holliday junction resolvase, RusA [Cellulophaga phage phi18:3]AGO48816.1 holliday junction resolvase, RusA [Cellulophaga phage phi46:3]